MSIWARALFLCSPLPLRNGSGALMRTLGCVLLCNTRSWTMDKEEPKRDERITCAVANFHTAFFVVCFYASLLWTFALISLNNSNIGNNWQSNSLEKQQQRESLWTLEAFELKLSLWKTYCYCCNKSPAPRRYCAPPTDLNGTPTQGRAPPGTATLVVA